MSASTIAGGGESRSARAVTGPASGPAAAGSVLTAPQRSRVSLQLPLAVRSLTAAHPPQWTPESTGGESHSSRAIREDDTSRMGVPSSTPSPKDESRQSARTSGSHPIARSNRTREVLTVNHAPQVLKAEAAAVRKMLDAYDKAIGQLYEARDDARNMLIKIEGSLRDSTPLCTCLHRSREHNLTRGRCDRCECDAFTLRPADTEAHYADLAEQARGQA